MKITINKLMILLLVLVSCKSPIRQDITHNDSSMQIDNQITLDNKEQSDSVCCDFENTVTTIGNGLIIAPHKIELYNDSLLTELSVVINMDSLRFKSKAKCSFYFLPEYGIMHYICLGHAGRSYKIIVDNSEIKYVPDTKDYQFKTWKDYILQSFGVSRKADKVIQPVKKMPKDDSPNIKIPDGLEMFCPMEMQGDWLKVVYDCFYQSDEHAGEPCHDFINECKTPIIGWIKWKEKQKILIEIALMP